MAMKGDGAMLAALFDVEGTLSTAQMGRGLLTYAREHGHKAAANRYYLSVLPSYALAKARLISDERMRQVAIGSLGEVLKGWTTSEANAAFDWVINDYILPAARHDVMERFQLHVGRGDATVLVSGMPVPCLQRLGAAIGATGVIGTDLEIVDDCYTGDVVPPVMVGVHKARRTQAFFAASAEDIDWAASYAYGDSIHDRALLDLVGHPIAVYPDAGLAELARGNSWEIIGGRM